MTDATGRPIEPGAGGGRRAADCRRQHGQCGEAHLRDARLRCQRLHAAMFRRRGRSARLPGRRRARHEAHVSSIHWPGVLSAYGMGLADQIVMREAAVERELDERGLGEARRLAARLQGRGVERTEGAKAGHAMLCCTRRTRARCATRGRTRPGGLSCPCGARPREALRRDSQGLRAQLSPAFRVSHAESTTGDRVGVGGMHGARRGCRRTAPRRRLRPAGIAAGCRRGVSHVLPCGGSAGWHEVGLYRVESLRAGACIDGPAILAERNATTVVEPGWQAMVTSAAASNCSVVRPRVTRHAAGTARRSRQVGVVQQSLHEHRRTDGTAPAEHRLFGEYQGATGFQLRGVRRRGIVDRQCTAHAGALGLDERIDSHGH